MNELYCCYCGQPKGDRISCCQENHFLNAQDYFDYTGEYPDDGREEADWCAELERGYAKDRI
jgi:hypothetical protein